VHLRNRRVIPRGRASRQPTLGRTCSCALPPSLANRPHPKQKLPIPDSHTTTSRKTADGRTVMRAWAGSQGGPRRRCSPAARLHAPSIFWKHGSRLIEPPVSAPAHILAGLGRPCHPPRSSKTRPLTLRRLQSAAHAGSASFLRHCPAFLSSACAIAPRTRLPCKSPAPTGVSRTTHRACRNSFNVCKSALRHQCTPQLLHFFAPQRLAGCFWHGETHFALPEHVSVLPAGYRPRSNLPDAAVPII
jgi:hypothetical protein